MQKQFNISFVKATECLKFYLYPSQNETHAHASKTLQFVSSTYLPYKSSLQFIGGCCELLLFFSCEQTKIFADVSKASKV
jgi:hypothetical protein